MRDRQKDVLTVEQAERTPSLQYPVCTSAWRPINNDSAHTKMAAHAAARRKKMGKLIMSVVCGGNRAMTFPDRGDISPIRVVPVRL